RSADLGAVGDVVQVWAVDARGPAVRADVVQVDQVAVLVLQTTQTSAEEAAGVGVVNVKAVFLDQREGLVDVLGQVAGLGEAVASRDGRRNESAVPGARIVHAEQDSVVQDAAELLRDQRPDLAPDVKVGVVKD